MSGLRAAGIPVSWTPMEWAANEWGEPLGPSPDPDVEGLRHGDIARRRIEHDAVVVHTTPVWHEQLAREARGRLLAAFTTWETDQLAPDWVATLNHYDRVIVPSQFNALVFASSGVTKPIRVVPHIARALPPAHGQARRHRGTPKFVFYTIATWSTRKAILDTVEAFVSAFSADDDVVLVIHTTPEDLVEIARPLERGERRAPWRLTSWAALANALGGRQELPEIVLSTRQLTDAEIDALHLSGDCFVSLSRGEGWGLGAFDAGAFANPVVVTGWSATNEFLPPGYPYRVEYDLVPTIGETRDALWAPRAGERWAKARVPHAAALLRQVFERRDEARRWGRALQMNVCENFNSERVTRGLLAALSVEQARGGRRHPQAVLR